MKKDHADKKQKNVSDEPEELIEDEEVKADNESADDAAVLLEENAKLKEEFLRVLAESENVKKRCAAEIEKNSKYAISSFAKDLLGVADNLARALQAGEGLSTECGGILTGVELTKNELAHVFEKFGIVPVESMGKVFDPNFHRVVQEIEDPSKPAGTIVAELQTGYLLNGRILREAMVVVTKGSN